MRLWFKAKTYGYGWTPCSWQGWMVIVVYIVLVVVTIKVADAASHSGSDTLLAVVPLLVIYTAVLIFISWKTGEKPRWRWGKD